jgi:CHASE3 domain sensor protein
MENPGGHRLLLQERSEAAIGLDRAQHQILVIYAQLATQAFAQAPPERREHLVVLHPSYEEAVEARQAAHARLARAEAAVRAWEGDLAEDARAAARHTLTELALVRDQALAVLAEARNVLAGLKEVSRTCLQP